MSSTAMKQTTSSFDKDTSDSDSSPLPRLKKNPLKCHQMQSNRQLLPLTWVNQTQTRPYTQFENKIH